MSQQSKGAQDQIDLADIGRVINRQRRKIIAFTVATTLLALLYVLFASPLFSAAGTLYLGGAQQVGLVAPPGSDSSGLGFLSNYQSTSDVQTQIDLIQSEALVEKAVLETGLNASVAQPGAWHLRYWNWRLFYGKQVDVFGAKPGDLKALYATLPESAIAPAGYKIIFDDAGNFHIVQSRWLFGSKPILSGTIGQVASGGGLSLLLKSAVDGVTPAAGSTYVLKVTPAGMVADLLLKKGKLSVLAGGTLAAPTKLGNLLLLWGNPYQGRDFVNQLMNDFIASQLSWQSKSASTTQDFISNQLAKVQESLASADRGLAAYQSQTGILDVPGNAGAVISQLSQYEVQRTAAQLQLESLQQLHDELVHPKGKLNPYLLSQTGDPVLTQLAGSLVNAETQLDALGVRFTGGSSELQVQQAQVSKIEESIRTIVHNDLVQASNNLANIDRVISQYETTLKSMPAESQQIIQLTRASQVYGDLYVLLMEKEEEAEVSKAATIVNTRVVTYARLPIVAAKPKPFITVLIGLLIGLFVSTALVIAHRSFSPRFQSEDEIRRSVSTPVFGVVPGRLRKEVARSIFSNRPQSPFAEAFRLLRGKLYQLFPDPKPHAILITSATGGEGKTTVSSNLAKALAEDGKKVVLVDADLHRGDLHEALNIGQAPGLTEWLLTKTRPPLKPVAGQLFQVLPSGVFPPNPSELLNSAAFGEVVAVLRNEFDFVILDGPPLPRVADSLALAKHADLILSVADVEHTPRQGFEEHNEALKNSGYQNGVIINGVRDIPHGYGEQKSSSTRNTFGRLPRPVADFLEWL